MKERIVLYRNPNKQHKFRAVFPEGKSVKFGLQGFSDYTKHKDRERMKRYIIRHAGSANGLRSRRENWSTTGKYTAGFWSRWLLWSEPSFKKAITRTERALGNKYKIFIN